MNGAANDDLNSTNSEDSTNSTTTPDEPVSRAAEPEDKQNTSSRPHLVVVSSDTPVDAHLMASRLKLAREQKGVSIEDVAHETRIHKDYIQALEEMRTDILPGMPDHKTYLRGYLKTYARFVGFKDADEVAKCYMDECGLAVEAAPVPSTTSTVRTKPIQRPALSRPEPAASKSDGGMASRIFAGVVIAASLGAIAWFAGPWSKDTPVTSTPSVNAPTSTAAAPPAIETTPAVTPAAVPVETVRPVLPASAPNLSLKAVRRAFITITGSDGTVYLSKEMAPGQVYLPRVNAGWTVTVRDGGAFEWRLDGQSLGTIAGDGEPAYAMAVDAALKREPVSPEG